MLRSGCGDARAGPILPQLNGAHVLSYHSHRILRTFVAAEAVGVGIPARLVAVAEEPKHRLARLACLHRLRPDRKQPLERRVTLTDPVVVLVRLDLAPVLYAGNGTSLAQNAELVFALQVVADIPVADAAALRVRVGIADQNSDGDRRPGALAEDLAALSA